MIKVYCKNCEYYGTERTDENACFVATARKGSSYFNEQYIDHKGENSVRWRHKDEFDKLIKDTKSKTGYIKYSVPCCNFNLNYNCKFYKKRTEWWKFWVK